MSGVSWSTVVVASIVAARVLSGIEGVVGVATIGVGGFKKNSSRVGLDPY